MESTFTGTVPTTTPSLVNVDFVSVKKLDQGGKSSRIHLFFKGEQPFDFEIELWEPVSDGSDCPTPLLLTQPRYYQIPWAEEALSRGYRVCLYPGVDSYHREKDYPEYDSVWKKVQAAYPDHSWTEIAVKAWIAGRALDYLLSEKSGQAIDSEKIGIIGFSRYGKQSLIATAMDPRIQCVVARSPGSPGSSPYRFTSRDTFAEAPADFPGEWFLPSLRDYLGREDELPIDAHGWYGLIAPRHCLIHTAHNDGSEPTFAVERAYLKGREVYRFLGAPEKLRVDYRPGQHGPITPEHIHRNLDWMDLAFGQGKVTGEDFPERLLHHFNWTEWRDQQSKLAPEELPTPVDLDSSACEKLERLEWLLGEIPADWTQESAADPEFLTKEESEMMTHDRWRVDPVERVPVRFGAGVRGNLYFDPNQSQPEKMVIWLHPLSYHSGYNEGYGVEGTTIYYRLAKAGYPVLAFDQCGFGLRLLEGSDFYDKYPNSSRLGRMVTDIQMAAQAVANGSLHTQSTIPELPANSIYLAGYSTGGTAALMAAGMDKTIAGVACFSGITPFRSMKNEHGFPGLEFWYEWHALVPNLGFFQDNQESIPVDFPEILSLVTPRPLLIHAPQMDRFADYSSGKNTLDAVEHIWPEERFMRSHPEDVQRFQADQHQILLNWLKSVP